MMACPRLSYNPLAFAVLTWLCVAHAGTEIDDELPFHLRARGSSATARPAPTRPQCGTGRLPELSDDVKQAYVEHYTAVVAIVNVTVVNPRVPPSTSKETRSRLQIPAATVGPHEVLRQQTVLLRGDLIAMIGPVGSVAVPEDAGTVIDGTGMSIFPGLVGMHEHMFYPATRGVYAVTPYTAPKLYLACGVTTARTGGTLSTVTDLNTQSDINAGIAVGPSIHVTGPYISGVDSQLLQMQRLTSGADAARLVDYWSRSGVTNYKAYMWVTTEQLGSAIETAHTFGHKVTGHLCSITLREAVDLGIDCLEHGLAVASDFTQNKTKDVCPPWNNAVVAGLDVGSDVRVQDLADHIATNGVAVTSTLAVFETMVPHIPRLSPEVERSLHPEALEAYYELRKNVDSQNSTVMGDIVKNEMLFERMFVERGGLLMSGVDPTGLGGVVAGYGDQRQLEMLVESGFSPVEALGIATRNGAVYLGQGECIGGVEAGMRADLVLVKGDVTESISNAKRIHTVFKAGVGYSHERLVAAVEGLGGWV